MASRKVETVADLQRQFIEHSGQQISYKAAYNQVSKEAFPVFVREVLVHLMNHLVNQSLPLIRQISCRVLLTFLFKAAALLR
jgi:hypothetical protein